MAIRFLESAGKHGYTADDAMNAMAHHYWVKRGFDQSRVARKADPTLWVGPAMDGGPIEVMTYIDPPRDVVVFHCMRLRDKFRRLMDGEETL